MLMLGWTDFQLAPPSMLAYSASPPSQMKKSCGDTTKTIPEPLTGLVGFHVCPLSWLTYNTVAMLSAVTNTGSTPSARLKKVGGNEMVMPLEYPAGRPGSWELQVWPPSCVVYR